MSIEKKQVIYKTFQEKVIIDESTLTNLKFLSQAMIYLWNIAIFKAEGWLMTNLVIKNLLSGELSEDDLSGIIFYLESLGNKRNNLIVVKKQSISPINFNYWLAEMSKKIKVDIGSNEVSFDQISTDLSRQLLVLLSGSYQSFFELKKKGDFRARKPEQKDPEGDLFQILTWSTARRERNKILLPAGKLIGTIEIGIPDRLLSEICDKEIKYVSIFKRDGKFMLRIVVSVEVPKQREIKFIRAVDLGAGDIAVTDSDGSEFLIPARRPDKYWNGQIKRVKSRISKCDKGSRAYHRRNNAKILLYAKGAHQRVDYQRKLANALTEEKVGCIVISEAVTRLGLARTESGSPEQHSGVQQTGYMCRMSIYIEQMAQKKGIKVIKVKDPKRVGDLNDPNSKFNASRAILNVAVEDNGFDVKVNKEYRLKHFDFNSSSGAGEDKGNRKEKVRNIIEKVREVMDEKQRPRRGRK